MCEGMHGGEKLGGHQVNPTQYVDGKNGKSFDGNFQRKKCNIAAQAWPRWADVSIGMNPLVIMDYQRKGGWRLF